MDPGPTSQGLPTIIGDKYKISPTESLLLIHLSHPHCQSLCAEKMAQTTGYHTPPCQ